MIFLLYTAQCVLCSVRCPYNFYDPVSDTIRRRGGYSGIFREEGVAVDTGAHFRGNHGSRVWKSQKCDKMYFPHTRTSWDKYMFIVIPKLKFQDRSELFGCAGKYTEQSTHCALGHLHWSSSWQWQLCIAVCRLFRTLLLTELADLAHFLQNVSFKNLTKPQNLFGVIFSPKTARKVDPKCFQNILSWLQSVGFYRRI